MCTTRVPNRTNISRSYYTPTRHYCAYKYVRVTCTNLSMWYKKERRYRDVKKKKKKEQYEKKDRRRIEKRRPRDGRRTTEKKAVYFRKSLWPVTAILYSYIRKPMCCTHIAPRDIIQYHKYTVKRYYLYNIFGLFSNRSFFFFFFSWKETRSCVWNRAFFPFVLWRNRSRKPNFHNKSSSCDVRDVLQVGRRRKKYTKHLRALL